MNDLIIRAKNLTKYYGNNNNFIIKKDQSVQIVDNINIDLVRGKTTALVGESGSGKTTTAKMLINVIKPSSGTVEYNFKNFKTNINQINKNDKKKFQKVVSLIFQDPYRSLSPRMNIKDIISEPLLLNNYSTEFIENKLIKLLDDVGMPNNSLNRYPHEFSGGQRQRISIARSLALQPEFIIADEPVSALDVSIQAQILNLLMDLQNEYKLTFLFISHDLRVIAKISDYIYVMYAGNIVEYGKTKSIYLNPHHPYTEALLKSVPSSDPNAKNDFYLEGEVADLSNKPKGCIFHPRCVYKKDVCKNIIPINICNSKNEITYKCHFLKNSPDRGPP